MKPITTAIAVAGISLPLALAGFDSAVSDNLGVYWGQNLAGGKQQRLSYFCENSPANIISISFLSGLRRLALNLANSAEDCSPIAGSRLVYCSNIDEDIKVCQRKWGKTILLSLGGDNYNEWGFQTPREARESAEKIWQTFGPSSSRSSLARPFGTAMIDGVDLHFETGKQRHMLPFAKEMRRLMNESPHRPEISKYLLTASLTCSTITDKRRGTLSDDVFLDAVFVKYYEGTCGPLDHAQSDSMSTLEMWNEWAGNHSVNSDLRVFISLSAKASALKSHTATASGLDNIVAYVKKMSNFGGIMIWEASYLDMKNGFLPDIAASLGALPTPEREPAPAFEGPKIELGHRPKSESADYYQQILTKKRDQKSVGETILRTSSKHRFRRFGLR